MNKKGFTLIQFIILLLILGIIVLVYFMLNKEEKKEEEPYTPPVQEVQKELSMQITQKQDCKGEKKYYFTKDGTRYYTSCLIGAWLTKFDKMSFDVGVGNGIYQIEDVYNLFHQEVTGKYILYENEDIRMYVCPNGDTTIGGKDLAFQDNFCKRECTFTKTYYILDVQEKDKQTFKLTLQYKEELDAVEVKKSFQKKYELNGAYEFTFQKDELDNTTVDELKNNFQTFVLKSVKKSTKDKDHFVNQKICGIN